MALMNSNVYLMTINKSKSHQKWPKTHQDRANIYFVVAKSIPAKLHRHSIDSPTNPFFIVCLADQNEENRAAKKKTVLMRPRVEYPKIDSEAKIQLQINKRSTRIVIESTDNPSMYFSRWTSSNIVHFIMYSQRRCLRDDLGNLWNVPHHGD